MADGDLFAAVTAPLRLRIHDRLTAHALPPAVAAATVELLAAVALVGLVAVVAAVGAAVRSGRDREWTGLARLAVRGAVVIVVVAAAGLFAWIVRRPSTQIHLLFARGDHLAFAALAGGVLGRLGSGRRTWAVILLSLGFLAQYSGAVPLAIAMSAGLLGIAALGVPAARPPWRMAVVQGALILAAYALCWWLRPSNTLLALEVYGLCSFVFLRHISFVVSACHGGRVGLASYLCYVFFYPGCMGALGAPEVYSEFSRRNLGGRENYDHLRGTRLVALGLLEIWTAARIPASMGALIASASTREAWSNSFLLFFQVALTAMGDWATIEGTALFYGFRLRPNFSGILRSENPSELWRSWRGSMTNWLVTHVYAPLGASRRHPALNILAAFGVSLVWHWMGVPFLTARFAVRDLWPIFVWALVSATAVIAHLHFQRRGWRLLPAGTPEPLRRSAKIFFTMCLGTLAATLPSFQLGASERLPTFIRLLVGLGPW